jgi:hypothetical protein
LAAAGRRMIQSTKVAWCRWHDRKRYHQHNVVQETRKEWTFGKRRWKGPECNKGIRNQGLRQQLRGSKQMKDLYDRWPLCLRKDNNSRHQKVKLRTPITAGKWRNTQEDPIWDFQGEDDEINIRIFLRVTKNDGLDIVEGSIPSEAEKETALA